MCGLTLKKLVAASVVLAGLVTASGAAAQSAGVAPTVIPLSGKLLAADGQPRTGTVVLALSMYDAQADPTPRFVESQTVTLDTTGGYSVQLGATFADGLPQYLFTNAPGTRWVGVGVSGEPDPPPSQRIMLLSVPYAAKAASADTLEGKPLSDFVLTSTFKDDVRTVLQDEGVATSNSVSTSAVTANYLQKGNGSGGTTDSSVFETGGLVGLGTAMPFARFHVSGVDNTIGAFPEMLLEDTTGMAPNVGGGFGLRGKYTSGGAVATFAAVKAGKENGGDGNYAGYLSFWTQPGMLTEQMRITSDGRVGIGISAPVSKLHVVGDTTITGNITVNGNIAAKYQDVAEWVDSAEPVEAGTIVIIDAQATNRVAPSTRSYDSRVAGAVSPQPGLVLGEPGEGKALIAQSGRVRVKADARFGAIRPGDLLVTSPTKGHVMRSQPVKVGGQFVHRPGTLVGKALEALPKGQGDILVLLTLQ
jgi:hypothetical protein